MKTQIQITTGQFEYIMREIEVESDVQAVEAFKALKQAYTASGKVSEGVTDKEHDMIIEKMMLGVSVEGGTELWSKATPAQQKEIKRVQRALARIKRKGVEEPESDVTYGHEGDGGPY